MTWKRLLIGLIIGLILIGVPVALYIYLDDSQPPSHPESDTAPLDHAVVDWVWSGAVTTDSAVVKARLPATVEARLAVQSLPELNAPHYVVPTRAAAEDGIAVFAVKDLEPDTQYYYAFELDGALNRAINGRFHTFGEGVYSFTIAASACASTGSNGAVFDTIRGHNPLFFLHMGDLHYENIVRNNPAVFHDAFDRVLTAPAQARLYRYHPIVYVWDDHDFGPNNSSSYSLSAAAARQAYEEAVPHYPLQFSNGQGAINQAFSVGRVRFIITDARSQRDAPRDTMLGTDQKAWLKRELLQAHDKYALIVWVSSVSWIADPPKFPLFSAGNWGSFPDERRELADFIAQNEINNLVMFAGDAHMLAIDDGSNTNFATDAAGPAFPLLQAAALDRQGSVKGGPYTLGPLPGGGQFAIARFEDTGEELRVEFSGHNYKDDRLLGLRFTVGPDGIINQAVLE